MTGFCDDCSHGCTERCAFIRDTEQPYFQAFRLATRTLGDDWSGADYMAWNSRQWAAFRTERGITQEQARLIPSEFQAWLFERVGHPDADSLRQSERVEA